MKKIYLVVASESHEPDEVIRSYIDKDKATKFCDKVNKYQEKHPEECPDYEADDKEWEEYLDIQDNWMKKHPIKGYTSYHTRFIVKDLWLVL